MSCCGGTGVTGLCGSCGCQPCSCNYIVIPPSGDTTTFAATNINLSGIGVYDSQSGNTFQFRGIDSASGALTVSLNATNHTVLLTLDVAAITAAIPQATPTVAGIGETAIDAEAQAKASTTVFVTPSNFAAMGASTSFAGFVELATDAEAIAGISSTLALSPANLTAVLATFGTTTTFADAATRAGTQPVLGQFGGQLDNASAWFAQSTTIGDWAPILLGDVTTTLSGTTTIAFSGLGQSFVFGDGSGFGVVSFSCPANFTDYVEVGGSVLTNSLLGGNGSGLALAYPVANLVSNYNVQTGYTAFTNPATIRTCNTATVTLQQLAQLVGTLITDLKNVLLPAT